MKKTTFILFICITASFPAFGMDPMFRTFEERFTWEELKNNYSDIVQNTLDAKPDEKVNADWILENIFIPLGATKNTQEIITQKRRRISSQEESSTKKAKLLNSTATTTEQLPKISLLEKLVYKKRTLWLARKEFLEIQITLPSATERYNSLFIKYIKHFKPLRAAGLLDSEDPPEGFTQEAWQEFDEFLTLGDQIKKMKKQQKKLNETILSIANY